VKEETKRMENVGEKKNKVLKKLLSDSYGESITFKLEKK